MSEKTFQNYFMQCVPHGYRTALVNGGGFPDCLLIKDIEHFLVELKMLTIGPSGDKMLRGRYKKSQLPWHMKYLKKGGNRIYTIFKITSNKYGIVWETPGYVRDVLDGMQYSGLKGHRYKEYSNLKGLIHDCFR